MSARPYVLAECHWKSVRATRYAVAVLPWGATEAHNLHLPYGTDTLHAAWVAEESARRAWERGARVTVLPPLPFGVHTSQLDIPLCINVNPSTQAAILRDIARSLAPHGVRHLVLLNGHGGNDFKPAIRELLPQGGPTIYAVDWWRAADARAVFAEPGDHAGELETSVVQHLAPHLALPLSEAGPGRERRSRLAAVREGWAWTPRPWTRITDDTGAGDPSAATAQKGARFLDAAAGRIAELLVELAALDPEDAYG